MKLTIPEGLVLDCLAALDYDEGQCSAFANLMLETGLDRKTVRRSCRSLKRKGLVEFHIGLWNDNGPAGSGYGVARNWKETLRGK